MNPCILLWRLYDIEKIWHTGGRSTDIDRTGAYMSDFHLKIIICLNFNTEWRYDIYIVITITDTQENIVF